MSSEYTIQLDYIIGINVFSKSMKRRHRDNLSLSRTNSWFSKKKNMQKPAKCEILLQPAHNAVISSESCLLPWLLFVKDPCKVIGNNFHEQIANVREQADNALNFQIIFIAFFVHQNGF